MDVPGEGELRRFLVSRLGEHVDPDRPLGEYGLSSREAVAVAGELGELVGRDLSPTLLWDHPTINRLIPALTATNPPTPGTAAVAVPASTTPAEPVAVIGVGCRFPGAHGPAAYWELLIGGLDAVGEVPDGRWEAFDDGTARTGAALDGVTRHGGFLDDVAGFDAEFFGIAPGEAAAMDPQQRLLLETAWEALQHAGIAPGSLAGTRTGVFTGISGNEYAHLTASDLASVDAWTATGASPGIAPNRLSYLLDLRGPSLAVDTACSSSLVATHLAVSGLRSGECDLALASGVNLLLSPVITVAFDRGGGTAPDGRCKAFDASADGMVRAEGCGVVVLKRLADAVRDGDRVLALVGATAVNQDGRSNGLVAPNPEAQETLLRQVYADRGPDYIEAHGTGTYLGDPIEARAIAAAVRTPVLLGSAKTNLGHLEAAAGIAGLIKTVLALHHGLIPPSLHFHRPNPHIPWDTLRVVTEPTPWPRRDARAGVSAFGFGGTNAHVVVHAYVEREPETETSTTETPDTGTTATETAAASHVFLLTGPTEDRVREHARTLATWRPSAPLGDVAHTLARRADPGRFRAAVVAANTAELAERLRDVHPVPTARAKGPVWVFGGYHPRPPALDLYDTEPAYRHTIDTLAPLLAEAGVDVYDQNPQGVATIQPITFAAQIALARLWRAYGFEPDAVIGHSMGEVAAAVVAGGLPVRDAVRVICTRARLLGGLAGGGAMAVVGVSAAEVPDDLHVAVYTAPGQSVVTGERDRVAEFAAEVVARGGFARTLTAEGAGHSPQVKPLLPVLREELAGIAGGKPVLPYYSVVFADPRETPTFEAAYWAAGVRRPVRLMQAVRAAAEDGHTLFTELSPRPLLTDALRDTLPADALITTGDFRTQVAHAATAITPRTRGRVVDVPPPPWHHTRHWTPGRRRHLETPDGHVWTLHADGTGVLRVEAMAALLHTAALEAYGEAELHDVVLHAVLPLPARVTITLTGDAIELSTKNAAGSWHLHATAHLTPGTAEDTPGTAERTPGLARIAHVAANGTLSGIETTTPSPAPTKLATKLTTRTWTPAPLNPVGSVGRSEVGSVGGWIVAADEGDARADRLRSLLGGESGDLSRSADPLQAFGGAEGLRGRAVVVLTSRELDPAGVRRVMLRVAALVDAGARVVIATERAQAVREGEQPDPGPAALRGLIRVLALERPEARARLVDFDDLTDLAADLRGRAVVELGTESDAEPVLRGPALRADDEVAWRGGVRYVARLCRVPLPAGRVTRVAGPGAYIITGGTGRLGRLVARWLAGRGATRIVLNGRSEASCEHLVVTGDLAAPGTAERLVAAATANGVRLRGVIHAAGVLDDRLVSDLDPESLERVWAAKVDGALRLHEATAALDLDWWVAFSSAAGLLGSPGQAAYATANAWLDGLCELRRAQGLPGISIAWGPWAGTAAGALPAVDSLTAEEGIEALEALIQRGLSAGVVKIDVERATELFPAITHMPYFSQFSQFPQFSHSSASRGPALIAQDPARDPAHHSARHLTHDSARHLAQHPARLLTQRPALDPAGLTPAEVLDALGKRVATVLGVETGRLGADVVLTDLGLDSLSATRLRGIIEHDFGVTVATAPLLTGATLGTLARMLTTDRESVPKAAGHPVSFGVGSGARDAAERQVVRVLGSLLGREPALAEVVTSGVLPQVLDALGRELGRPLPLPAERPATAPTLSVEALADVVREMDEAVAGRELIRPLNGPARTGRPLFLAHPAGGTTGVYALLADRLPAPVLGLERLERPEGPEGLERMDGGGVMGIPERAAHYAQAIKDTCQGPYRLGGWSFGGILAFEIAHRLGGEAELVVMIDSGLPEPVPEAVRREAEARRYVDFAAYLRRTYNVHVRLEAAELLGLATEEERMELVRTRMAESGAPAALPPSILRHQLASHQDTRAIERYRPAPYHGRVVLYRSTEPAPWAVRDFRYAHEADPARGFGPYATDLEIVEIPGSHHLNLLDPPHVEIVAKHLGGLL
ncbi:SDR family NAD(P)-dependent oxidoreductase [Nonomuraea sp. NPDC048882]|uniref:SDR family NAD(P)-dependent oxidoreductase n=1 Tax=Nonomuraea sp. NPDC048882 TaxID=3154347 RepID=UPI0033DF0393